MEAFTNAVLGIKEISRHLKPGLSALKGNSCFIKTSNPKSLNGSVDIDEALKNLMPGDNRWDYVFGYVGKAYFIEVHPADTSNAKEMLKKVAWLKTWLSTTAQPLKDIHADGCFHWCPSGRVKISPNSPQYRQMLSAGIRITKILNLR